MTRWRLNGAAPIRMWSPDTFVTAITGFGSFDPGKGTTRSWVFGIARHVYAAHCEAYGQQQNRPKTAGPAPYPAS